METDKSTVDSNQNEIICKNCGGKLSFAPGTESLECPYCKTQNEIKVDAELLEKARTEIDYFSFIRQQTDTAPEIEVLTVKCNGCGAETSFDPNVVSGSCDFCGSPLASKEGHKSKLIEPGGLLPFKVKDKEGVNLYKTWLKKLWFAPGKLKSRARQVEKISGIYIPYWTFDAQTTTDYSGQRGDDYHDEETYYDDDGEEQTRTVTHTDWTSVRGRVSRFFDDMLVAASKSLPVNYLNALEPWDLENLLPYDTKYLSGFKSESYQDSLEDGFEIAKKKMESIIEGDIRRDIGGDHQKIDSYNTSYNNVTFKHVLLPIWISAYKYQDKVYRFMINGRTGEVRGERPYSWIKIILTILAVIGIGVGIYYLSK